MRVLAMALACALAGPAAAAPGAGSAGGLLARIPFGARVLALGGSQGALPDSPASLLANPAALGAVGPAAVEMGLDQGIEGVRYGGIAAGAAVLPWLSAGAAAQTLSAGTIETWDFSGASYTADLESDILISGAAAARLGGACAGLAVKYAGSKLLGTASSSALLADVGFRLHLEMSPPDWFNESATPVANPNWIALSLAAANIGGGIDYGGASDPSPLVWRAGVVTGHSLSRASWVLFSLALDVPRSTAQPAARAGVEAAWPVSVVEVAVRAGARMLRDGGTLSAGLGAAVRGVSVDYAFVGPVGPFGSTHHFSVGFNLAGFRPPASE